MAIAIASGLHSDPLIWDTGVVPVAPEVVVIPAGVVVTQAGSWDIGDGVNSLSITGELIANDLITYRGDINLYGILSCLSGLYLTATSGNWTIIQYDGSTWRNTPGAVKPVFDADAGGYWMWRDSAATAGYTIDIDGVELYRCGDSAVEGVLQRGNNAASLNIRMRNFLWHTCGQLRLGVGATHHVDAICQVDSPVIINPQSTTSCINYAARFPDGWPTGSRYLRDIYVAGLLANGGVSTVLTTRKNLRTNPRFEVSLSCAIDARYRDTGGGAISVSGSIMFDQYTGSISEINHRIDGETFAGSVMVYASRNNAHIYALPFASSLAAPGVVFDSLVEFDSTGGPNFLPHKNGVELLNSLIINGNPFYSTYASDSGVARYEHCTHVILSDGLGQPSMLQETNQISPPAQVRGQSNIRVDLRAAPDSDFAAVQPSIPAGTPDQYTWLDYNNHYVPSVASPFNPYPTVVITGLNQGDAGFGGSDLFVDPQFQFSPRSLKDFDALHGGPGTAINLWREFFKHSGYDYLGNPAVADPAVTPAAAKSWVSAAYVPTNSTLQGVAHDGRDVGAFAVVVDDPLVVSNSVHGHTVEFADLSLSVNLLVDGLAHVHSLDDFAVTADYQLLVDGLWHANQLGDVVLSADHQLLVDDVRHALVMDDVQLSGDVVLVVDDLLHSSMSSDLTLFDAAKFIGNHNVIMARSRGRVIIVAKSR